ncbi:MAG: rod shape-determining protein RodA [Prolixibacteraceae bacterium]|jgi:rod shape determining protein RodA|nr:rod shape-determining protein RodA [Prolixibacteraceae bacterium]
MAKRNSLWANLDWTSVTIYLLMVLLGWINIYAAVYNEEHKSIFDFSQRYGKQAIWIVAAFFIAIAIIVTDSRVFVSFAYPIYALIIFLLIAVLLFGTEIKGARSWFQIGSFALQPSEFAKLATALALSKYLSSFNFKIHSVKSLLIVGIILLFPVLLIFLQNDTGSALVFFVFLLVLYREGMTGTVLFFGFLFALLFVFTLVLSPLNTAFLLVFGAFVTSFFVTRNYKESLRGMAIAGLIYSFIWGTCFLLKLDIGAISILLISLAISALIFSVYAIRKRMKNLLLIIGFLIGSMFFILSVDYVFNNVLEKHHQSRINELLGIESNPLGAGYNVNQSKIAIGSGGFFGKGFLNGTQTKFDFVPEQSTDFIFCTVGEEWGFIGTTSVIGLFLLLFTRILRLAEKQRTKFSRIYGYCVACILFYHFAINIGMTIGLAPVIGIPLPFFSYGGSSLWSFTILLFIFLRLDASRFEQLGF